MSYGRCNLVSLSLSIWSRTSLLSPLNGGHYRLEVEEGRPPRTTERPTAMSLSLPCFYAAENAAGVQFITVMYHLLRGKGEREEDREGGREGGRERREKIFFVKK